MKDFYLSRKECEEDLIKCENCIYFNASYNKENGECVCVVAKFYKDIMKISDNCDYFYMKLMRK